VFWRFLSAFFNKSVPFFTSWAFTEPFWGFITTVLTKKSAFGFGHARRSVLTKVFKKRCPYLAFKDLIRIITEIKNKIFKKFELGVC
jgi:hypothetical protein